MALQYHPQPGTIVRVDLSEGFRPPEMVKRRPAIVISPQLPDRATLCAIVPLSTTPPNPARAYHCQLELDPPLPFPYDNPRMWVKADMVLTVGLGRLDLLQKPRARGGMRAYDVRVIDARMLAEVRTCIAHALGMPHR